MQVVVVRGVLQVLLLLVFSCFLTKVLIMATVIFWQSLSLLTTMETRVSIILALVAVTGGLRILFIFTSFSRLPLGDSTTILFSSPVVVMFLSIFILKEKCGVFRVCASASLVLGVVLISKPPLLFVSSAVEYDLLGYSLVLLACFMSALGMVLMKFISGSVPKPVILFYLGLATSVCGTTGLLTLGRPDLSLPLWEWGVTLAIGLVGLLLRLPLPRHPRSASSSSTAWSGRSSWSLPPEWPSSGLSRYCLHTGSRSGSYSCA